jgi:hypothetical protein
MTPQKRTGIEEAAKVLAIVCPPTLLAEILAATVGCDDDERLSDWQAEVAGALCYDLQQASPEALAIAQEM